MVVCVGAESVSWVRFERVGCMYEISNKYEEVFRGNGVSGETTFPFTWNIYRKYLMRFKITEKNINYDLKIVDYKYWGGGGEWQLEVV